MKSATVRELRTAFPRLESWLAEGETVSITKHKKIVAKLIPAQSNARPNFAQRFTVKSSRVFPGNGAVHLLLEERGG